ncbi:MAG: AI-2E family transporter [Acidobacteriaceae bacterium]|nr:AI-2E family transporter [Acidobacteriaceae bacterium]
MASDTRSNIVFAFFVAILLLVAWHVRTVLFLIYISALAAIVISPAIDFVRRINIAGWRPGRVVAIVVILVLGFGLLTLFFVFALPPIFHDIREAGTDAPTRIREASQRLQRIPVLKNFDIGALQSHLTAAIGGVFGLFKGIAGGLFGFFSFLVLSIYFFLDGASAFYWFMSLFPPRHRERLEPTLLRAEQRMRKWLAGQAALMLILGSLSTIVFGLLHIKYFYALGVFAGIANIIPIVGPVATVIAAGSVAAFEGWGKLTGVVTFYLVYQEVEHAYLTPTIMRSTVNLPPLAVITSLAIGGALFGILGALIAVPTAALIAVLVEEYLVQSRPEPLLPLTPVRRE